MLNNIGNIAIIEQRRKLMEINHNKKYKINSKTIHNLKTNKNHSNIQLPPNRNMQEISMNIHTTIMKMKIIKISNIIHINAILSKK